LFAPKLYSTRSALALFRNSCNLGEEETAMSASDETRTFLISVAAQLAGMHAQTLRTYDRLGLVTPQRSTGGGRRYSQRDVDLLREVQRLSQDEGVNLAGIKRIIELTNQVEALQSRVRELAEEVEQLRGNQRRDVAVVPKSTALVVWEPRRRRTR
jgi:MerR family transcriptional regulator/heat shock protein HspR